MRQITACININTNREVLLYGDVTDLIHEFNFRVASEHEYRL